VRPGKLRELVLPDNIIETTRIDTDNYNYVGCFLYLLFKDSPTTALGRRPIGILRFAVPAIVTWYLRHMFSQAPFYDGVGLPDIVKAALGCCSQLDYSLEFYRYHTD
jgi:hypothetical protein